MWQLVRVCSLVGCVCMCSLIVSFMYARWLVVYMCVLAGWLCVLVCVGAHTQLGYVCYATTLETSMVSFPMNFPQKIFKYSKKKLKFDVQKKVLVASLSSVLSALIRFGTCVCRLVGFCVCVLACWLYMCVCMYVCSLVGCVFVCSLVGCVCVRWLVVCVCCTFAG